MFRQEKQSVRDLSHGIHIHICSVTFSRYIRLTTHVHCYGFLVRIRQLTQLTTLKAIVQIMLVVFDERCRGRVLCGYVDGKFQVQFTFVLGFREFTEIESRGRTSLMIT
jgi:hypothetical protein